MNSRSKTIFASLLFVVPFLVLIIYKVAAYTQQPLLITLKSSGGVVEASGPIRSIFSSNDGKTVYMVNDITGEVEAFSSEPNIPAHSLTETSGPIAIGADGYTAQVDKDLNIAILDPAGNRTVGFSTYPVTSLALLSNGNTVVASPTKNHLLHVYSPTGHLIKSFGAFKEHDKTNPEQNRFLHKGKVLVDASGNIYYVSRYVPLIQKFSSDGELEYEVEVKGDAIDLQKELAQRFFSTKDAKQVGGIGIINSATIDHETGHLWICMSGSSVTGVVYEYSAQGEKLREYALEVSSSVIPKQIIIGVNDLAITKSKLYALTPQNQVYSFDRSNGKPTRISRSNLTMQHMFLSYIPGISFLPALNMAASARTQAGCAASQPWGDCTYNCPGPACNGTTPTATSSNSSMQDCKAALSASLSSGYAVVTSQCQQYTPGTAMHMRGGCRSDVTVCREGGVQSNHNITLDCPSPTCSGGGGGGGGGEEGCDPFLCSDMMGVCIAGVCVFNTPVILDVDGDGFSLTNAANGVRFDLNSDGSLEQLSWTSANSDDAWLALDRNHNGVIDNGSELFGNFMPQPTPPPGQLKNGFLALAEYDKSANGGNRDGQVDNRDSIFSSLRLWQDTNHNGISEPSELYTLSELGVAILDLDYKESRRTDEHGNKFRWRAKVKDARGAQVGRWAWDVILLKQ